MFEGLSRSIAFTAVGPRNAELIRWIVSGAVDRHPPPNYLWQFSSCLDRIPVVNRDEEKGLSRAESNRLYTLTNKQNDQNLEDGEALELFRLSQKKARQVIAHGETNRSN